MTEMKQELPQEKTLAQMKTERYAAISVKLGKPADDIVSRARELIANADGPLSTHDLVHQICVDNPSLFGKLNGDILNKELEIADESTSMNDIDGRIHYKAIEAVVEGDAVKGDLGGVQKLG
jgi:hypothetical protein